MANNNKKTQREMMLHLSSGRGNFKPKVPVPPQETKPQQQEQAAATPEKKENIQKPSEQTK